MASLGNPPLFLNNHRGGGIGDFGLSLERHLRSCLEDLESQETAIDGRGSLRQAAIAATHQGPLIANIGLTAWGRSGPRNFLGFAAVGFHQSLGFSTKVIVHHAIEMFALEETGYSVPALVQAGAHRALRQVRKCELIVFSPRLATILANLYDAHRVWLVPLPGERVTRFGTPSIEGRPKVVHAGYWAPYKGINLFLELASRMSTRAEFLLVGKPHAGLSTDATFRQLVEGWKAGAIRSGVRLTGFLTSSELDHEFSVPTVGILPYTSVSGASGSFQLFAERAVPVVATDLPEFRYLEHQGAGILIAPNTLSGFSEAVASLLDDRKRWHELARRQVEFNETYSWENFVAHLLSPSPGSGSYSGR